MIGMDASFAYVQYLQAQKQTREQAREQARELQKNECDRYKPRQPQTKKENEFNAYVLSIFRK
jgi:hypothetical protein